MPKSIEPFIEGEHYLSLGLLTLAQEKFEIALQTNRTQHDLTGIGVCLFYLTQIAIAEKNQAVASKYLAEARQIYQQRGMQEMLKKLNLLEHEIKKSGAEPANTLEAPEIQPATPINPITLLMQGEFKQAREIFARDVAQLRQQPQPSALARALLYLGQCELFMDQPTTARTYLNESQQIALQNQDTEVIAILKDTFDKMQYLEEHQQIDKTPLNNLLATASNPQEKLLLALAKAEILLLKKRVAESEIALHQARKLLPEQHPEKFLTLILLTESKLLVLKNRVGQAPRLLDFAQQCAEKTQDPALIALVKLTRSQLAPASEDTP
ncbi:hypothetical protein L0128_01970 [candidate division KSB1 bacterium]|nr:hypothetical protein [candidate division KSB1 bacterium]